MKLLTVVGTRPQIIKSVLVSKEFSRLGINEVLVNTGQHYDYELSSIFFEEFMLPITKYNLGIGSGTHNEQLANILLALEKIVRSEAPIAIMVYGDTNSTLGASLTAAKLNIPIIHVESGLRSYDTRMPEEINRYVTDHLSELLLCTGETALMNLKKEGLSNKALITGDLMYDMFLIHSKLIDKSSFENFNLKLFGNVRELIANEYILMTLHRQNIVADESRLIEILKTINKLNIKVVFPIHPNTKKKIKDLIYGFDNITFLSPLGYKDMLTLTMFADTILTDSGGLMREAFFARKRLIVLRENTEFPEIFLENSQAYLIYDNLEKFAEILSTKREDQPYEISKYFGSGGANNKIVSSIISFLGTLGKNNL